MVNEEAEECKKKGNEAFKEHKWDEAIKHYNKAIALDPTNAAYYSNRSGAWSSKGSHDSALADANKCISQDAQFVKGYARKGKALFDMDKWAEAETAYNEGLKVDPANEGCKRGLSDVTAARQRRASAGASRPSGGGGSSMFSGIMPKIMEKFKKGGRMQSYLVILVVYYVFTTLSGRFTKKTDQSDNGVDGDDSVDYDEDADMGSDAKRVPTLGRHFGEVDGSWFSYLHASQKSDSALLLLHRSGLSAQGEFGAILPRLSANGPQVLAPDRPCHGYSPCKEGEESAMPRSWLPKLIGKEVKKLALAASGREAARQALALAALPGTKPKRLWLLSPGKGAPDAKAGLEAWLRKGQGKEADEVVDMARWAARPGAAAKDEEAIIVPKKLPERCQVNILYEEDEKEDEDLTKAFKDLGLSPTVRVMAMGETLHDALVEEVQQAMGEAESSAS